MFIFKEGLILPAFYSPELMEDNDCILPIMPLVPGYPCTVPGPVPGYPWSVPACPESVPKEEEKNNFHNSTESVTNITSLKNISCC